MAVGLSTSGVPAVLAGRYRVLGAVGRGAIAEVVRARDERTGAELALKILYPHLRDSAVVVERFRREVDIVRRIAHPHVLAIHDVADSDGQLFLVMDYHPGGDLADRLASRRRLGPDDVRVLALQLCGALAAAHRRGVVHRDVKPSNVLCGQGPGLDVRLCDFGLARATELSGLTTANAVLGTPEYMAPEVVTDGHADPRSDVYSLGVMLFEAATGRLPFYGDSPYQLMRQHVDVEAPRARRLAPDLPPAIDDAIARALAKDPLDRFATCEDFARALEREDSPRSSGPLVPAREAAVVRRTCKHCGGWVVDAAGVCADCGKIMLRLDYAPDGVSVLVTGPGKAADKIDVQKQIALYKILDELPAGSVSLPRRGRRAPRLPFYVAKGITRSSASALVERLHGMELEAIIREDADQVVRKAIRSKVWQLTQRPLAGFGVLGSQGLSMTPSDWPLWARLLPDAIMACAGAVTLGVAIRGMARPLVSPPGGSDASSSERQLTELLGRLDARQDRRLVAHVLERLEQIQGEGDGELRDVIADRAARAGSALAAFDDRRRHGASVSVEPLGALEELRREEVTRVALRAHLLRAASWLDRLCFARARVSAADAAETAGQVRHEIDSIGLAVDAEGEIAGLLGNAP